MRTASASTPKALATAVTSVPSLPSLSTASQEESPASQAEVRGPLPPVTVTRGLTEDIGFTTGSTQLNAFIAK